MVVYLFCNYCLLSFTCLFHKLSPVNVLISGGHCIALPCLALPWLTFWALLLTVASPGRMPTTDVTLGTAWASPGSCKAKWRNPPTPAMEQENSIVGKWNSKSSDSLVTKHIAIGTVSRHGDRSEIPNICTLSNLSLVVRLIEWCSLSLHCKGPHSNLKTSQESTTHKVTDSQQFPY